MPTSLLDVYADEGVDTVELGWPARDPFLDGADVRASMLRAAEGSPPDALATAVERLSRHHHAPDTLVMTYAEDGHPLLTRAGLYGAVDATLVLAPGGNAIKAEIERGAKDHGAQIASFVDLPVTAGAVEQARAAEYYVMLQAAEGMTGPRAAIDAGNVGRVADLRARQVTAPIVLGFGISSGEQARAAIDFGADGVVVGSAVLRAALTGPRELSVLLKDLRDGLDA